MGGSSQSHKEIVDSLQAITAKCLKLHLSVELKKKKNSSRFLAIVFTFHMEVKGNMICVMWGRLPQHEPLVKNVLNKCDFLG